MFFTDQTCIMEANFNQIKSLQTLDFFFTATIVLYAIIFFLYIIKIREQRNSVRVKNYLIGVKGQLISKCLFGVFNSLQKKPEWVSSVDVGGSAQRYSLWFVFASVLFY